MVTSEKTGIVKHILHCGHPVRFPQTEVIVEVRVSEHFFHIGNSESVPTSEVSVHVLGPGEQSVHIGHLFYIPSFQAISSKEKCIFKHLPHSGNLRSLPLKGKKNLGEKKCDKKYQNVRQQVEIGGDRKGGGDKCVVHVWIQRVHNNKKKEQTQKINKNKSTSKKDLLWKDLR